MLGLELSGESVMEGHLEAKEKDCVSVPGVGGVLISGSRLIFPVLFLPLLSPSRQPLPPRSQDSGAGGWGSKSSGLAGKGEAASATRTGLNSGRGFLWHWPLLSQFTGTGETPSW